MKELVREIDARLIEGGFNPLDPATAAQLRAWPIDAWEDLAEDVGLGRAPTVEEVKKLVGFFEKRSERAAA